MWELFLPHPVSWQYSALCKTMIYNIIPELYSMWSVLDKRNLVKRWTELRKTWHQWSIWSQKKSLHILTLQCGLAKSTPHTDKKLLSYSLATPPNYEVRIQFCGPPLWSSGQSSWLQIRRPGFNSRHYQNPGPRVQFPALPEKKSSGSGTGSTQPCKYNWVYERTIPTERPPLVGEVIANFCG
jgi:hypothetical protein